MEKINVGIIGCGNISTQYVKACRSFHILNLAACADLDFSRAEALAKQWEIPKACTVEELLADPAIQIVINLTIPKAHLDVNLAAIRAGKNIYSEKPLGINRREGKQIVDAAKEAGVLLGCAPDTFLGGGLQTCRKLIDEGAIGRPVAATAFMTTHGVESWHPNAENFYQVGAGPMFDMGPYYLTALVNLVGPIRGLSGMTRISFPERTFTLPARAGEKIKVETATHVTGLLDFEGGAVGTIITSFDVWAAHLPYIEIYGTEGSLSVPNPNVFGGEVQIGRSRETGWESIPLTHSVDVGRGIGVADMAYALVSGRPHRANGDLAYHVLDLMEAFEDASQTNAYVKIQSTCTRPAPLPLNLPQGELDA
jgi:predicted dehydrogenase